MLFSSSGCISLRYRLVKMGIIYPTDILSLETWLLLGTIGFLCWLFFHRKWQYLKNLGVPHETPSLMKFGSVASSFVEPFAIDLKLKEKFGNVWGFYFLTDPCIMVHDLDMIRQIYIKEFSNFPIRQNKLTKIYGKELGAGITVTSGEQWKRVRSSMTPTFSSSKLRKMIPIMDWCSGNTVASLKRKCETKNGVFNAKELFSRLSLDVVCSAAFSTNVDSQDDTKPDPQIIVHAKKLFSTPFFSPMMILSFLSLTMESIFVKLGFSLFPKDISDYFKGLANYIIDQRKAGVDDKSRVDLLTLMLDSEISEAESQDESKRGMTKLEIVGNCMVMILAGYENTGNQMSFLAYNLATHPEIQAKLQKEIDEMIDSNETIDYECVNNLKLLDMCLHESMRLYTPLLRNSRICMKDTTISGVKFPKGVAVGIPVYALAHDPEYWDEPYKFNPERMREMGEIDPIMFQPFGGGPRNCIGIRFAILEMKLAFCRILRKFTLKPAENTPKPPMELLFAGAAIRSKVDFDLVAEPRS